VAVAPQETNPVFPLLIFPINVKWICISTTYSIYMYSSVLTRYWVTIAKQTTNHQLLCNKFLISKYTQSLLSNAFGSKQVLMATSSSVTTEKLLGRCFLRGPCRYIVLSQSEQDFRVVREYVKRRISGFSWKSAGNEVGGETKESPLLNSVTEKRLLKTQQIEET
jgi:hypothetical protein